MDVVGTTSDSGDASDLVVFFFIFIYFWKRASLPGGRLMVISLDITADPNPPMSKPVVMSPSAVV